MRKVIGNNIKAWRKKQKLSQHQLAEKCFLEQKDICNIENYRWNFGVDKISMLARGLHVHPFELLLRTDEITPKLLLEREVFAKGVALMLYQYYLILSRMLNEEISSEPIESYGIGLKDHAIPCVKDISPDRKFVESLVALCNTYQVDPVHLQSVVEDALFEKEH